MKAKLERQLKIYDRDIKVNPNNAKAFHEKADALLQLKEAVSDGSYNKEELSRKALECYTKAIELNPTEANYFADRSKLYVAMGANELAVKDIQKVKDLPASSNPIDNMHLNNTVKELAKLDSVQNTIKQLKDAGKIDSALAEALEEHAKVTANLVVQVGAHGERLDSHDQSIGNLDARTEELVLIVQALAEGRKVDEAQIARLVHDTGALKGKVEENTARIQGIELQASKTEKKVDELSEKLETFRSTAEELRQKIEANKRVGQKDKEKMQSAIKSMEKSITGLAKQEDIVKITAAMKTMIREGEFTQDMLTDLQTQIDEMRGSEGQGSTTATAFMLRGVVYDNPLLNHPELFQATAREFGLSRTLDLSARLDHGLVDEAVRNSDVSVILGGLLSLSYDHQSASNY